MREEGEEAHRAWGYCRSLSLLRGCHEPKSTRKFCLQKSMMSSPKRVKVQEAQWQKILALFTITGLRKDPVFSEVTHFIHWLCNSDSQSNGPELGLDVVKWYKFSVMLFRQTKCGNAKWCLFSSGDRRRAKQITQKAQNNVHVSSTHEPLYYRSFPLLFKGKAFP